VLNSPTGKRHNGCQNRLTRRLPVTPRAGAVPRQHRFRDVSFARQGFAGRAQPQGTAPL